MYGLERLVCLLIPSGPLILVAGAAPSNASSTAALVGRPPNFKNAQARRS